MPEEMTSAQAVDRSNGYESIALDFMFRRTRSSVGVTTVREWAKALPRGAAVLDLGCGHGVPVSEAMASEDVSLYAVDASPTMVAAFRARFPSARAECSAVEDSQFFGRNFDAVVAWGLMFLLAPDAQATLIQKVSAALKPGGRFLFTSPRQVCEWPDNLTGQKSISLGAAAYRRTVEAAGMVMEDEVDDEGENHYYFVRKPDSRGGAV
jgi:2-polyprenyl-3-methyl-5-hydroxy-6-metoxy-1,4-benzoquinol methylase